MKKQYNFDEYSETERCRGCDFFLKKSAVKKGFKRCYKCYLEKEKLAGHIMAGQRGMKYFQSQKRLAKGIGKK